jgi:RNA polymerase sigma-70 factor (ECF subfamily)
MTRMEPMEVAGRSPVFQEKEIVVRLKAGDSRGLGLLVDHFGEDLMSYLLAILGKQDQAEDVFQDTWVRVMEHMHQFDADREFSPWLFRIARNLAFDRLRRQRWKNWLRLGSGNPEDPVIDVAAPGDFRDSIMTRNIMSTLLGSLDPQLREIIWLRYYQDMRYEEMAYHCRLPLGTVKSRLARALHQLGERYRNLKGAHHG